jgi:hypothetical protein
LEDGRDGQITCRIHILNDDYHFCAETPLRGNTSSFFKNNIFVAAIFGNGARKSVQL